MRLLVPFVVLAALMAGCLGFGEDDEPSAGSPEASDLMDARPLRDALAAAPLTVVMRTSGGWWGEEGIVQELRADPANEVLVWREDWPAEDDDLDKTYEQEGRLINLRQGGMVLVGRDERFDATDEVLMRMLARTFPVPVSAATLGDLYPGFEVDEAGATTWEGRAARRLAAHRDEVRLEYVVDQGGAPMFWETDGPAGRFEYRFAYGPVEVELREEGPRIATGIIAEQENGYENDATTNRFITERGTIAPEQPFQVRLDELEMRAVVPTDQYLMYHDEVRNAGDFQVMAAMRLDEGRRESADFTFEYEDADGDGLLSAGDSYFFKGTLWDGGWPLQTQVHFFDRWADSYEGDRGGQALAVFT